VGRHLGSHVLFISTARILWGTNLKGKRDENGKEVPLDTDIVDTGLVV
jgi:hypothetical protein